jgi:hypothetical protein
VCALALAGTLCLWLAAATQWTAAEIALHAARTAAQKTSAQLSALRSAANAHQALMQRLADLRAALPPRSAAARNWEGLANRLAADTRIAKVTLHAQDSPTARPPPAQLPGLDIQHLQIDAHLLHEETLLALDAALMDTSERVIPAGCALRRDAGAAPLHLRAHCEYDWIAFTPDTEAAP